MDRGDEACAESTPLECAIIILLIIAPMGVLPPPSSALASEGSTCLVRVNLLVGLD